MTTDFGENFMSSLVGYRPEAESRSVPYLVAVALEAFVKDIYRETRGTDWIGDPVDLETVQVRLDEQYKVANAWLEDNFDRIVGEVESEIEEETKREEQERENSVPLRW